MTQPYIGSLGDLGYAKEAVFGTAVPAAAYVAFKDESLEKNPGITELKLVRAARDTASLMIAGEQKVSGKTTFPFFSLMGMPLLVGAIGQDQYQVGSTPGAGTTLSAGSTIGATTISVASSTGLVAGTTIVQIDTAVAKLAECRKVVTISGVGPYTLTLDSAMVYAHANAAAVVPVVAPFTHYIVTANTLPSFTLEKNLGGLESLQYTGMVAAKLNLKGATKGEVECALDWMGQDEAAISPTVATYTTDTPTTLAGVSLSLFGASDANVETFELDIDNDVKEHYTYSGKRYPTFITPAGRKITMKFSEALTAMTYYNQLAANNLKGTPPVGVQTITLVDGAANQSVITLPQTSITKLSQPIKVGDVIMVDVTMEAWLGSVANTLNMTTESSQYLAY